MKHPATMRETSLRWAKFSMVGTIGIGVQLGTLAALTAAGMNYLLATVLAVEAAVVHNFVWHQNFTWSDRAGGTGMAIAARFGRFNLTTGAISIVGNLLLMALLVGGAGLPALAANVVTIAACALANFLVNDRFVFLAPWPERCPRGRS